MTTEMNCKRARSEIALWAGGDLDEADAHALDRHVAACPDCREYRQRLQASVRLVQARLSEPPQGFQHRQQREYRGAGLSERDVPDSLESLDDSVWPGLVKRLPTREQLRRTERLNRWMPLAAGLAACLAVIAFTANPNHPVPRRALDGTLYDTPPIRIEGGESLDPFGVGHPAGTAPRQGDVGRELRIPESDADGYFDIWRAPRSEEAGRRNRRAP